MVSLDGLGVRDAGLTGRLSKLQKYSKKSMRLE